MKRLLAYVRQDKEHSGMSSFSLGQSVKTAWIHRLMLELEADPECRPLRSETFCLAGWTNEIQNKQLLPWQCTLCNCFALILWGNSCEMSICWHSYWAAIICFKRSLNKCMYQNFPPLTTTHRHQCSKRSGAVLFLFPPALGLIVYAWNDFELPKNASDMKP